MWVFTKDGFFSIVRHREYRDLMMVRARVREDLERAFPQWAGEGDLHIIEDDDADYRFRVILPEARVRQYLDEAVTSIDYTTGVKDQIDQGDPDRHSALYDVWQAFYDFQTERYGPQKWRAWETADGD
jgi:hypothetical protein